MRAPQGPASGGAAPPRAAGGAPAGAAGCVDAGARPQRPCGLCHSRLPVDDLLGPDCDHLFCAPCLRAHVLAADFLRKRVNCPACDMQMTPPQISHAVGADLYAQKQAEMALQDEELARKMAEEMEALERAQVAQEAAAGQNVGGGVVGAAAGAAPLDPSAVPAAASGGGDGGHGARERTFAPPARAGAAAEAGGAGSHGRHFLAAALNPAAAPMVLAAQGAGGAPAARPKARAMPRLGRTCGLCGSATEELMGPPACQHRFCTPCLRGHTVAIDFAHRPVLCPASGCSAELPVLQVQQLVGEELYALRQSEADAQAARALQERFTREAEQAQAQNEFQCPLCLDHSRRDEAIELDCDHKFCAPCFRAYLESKIQDAQVAEDELICPIPDCRKGITVLQVEGAVTGTPLWDKFLQFRARLWRPASADGAIVDCPTPGCGQFVVPPDAEFVQCPVCNRDFCPRCGSETHPGVTCQAFKAWRADNANVDQHFEELMAQERWRRCPKCGAPSERESGCNFMQCRSETCRKRTYWCYVCGKELAKEDHYTHFPKGPYEDECHTPEAERLWGPPPEQTWSRSAAGAAVAVGQAGAAAVAAVGGAVRGWLVRPVGAA